MSESLQNEPNFLFQQAEQLSSQIQLIIKKQEASYHNYLITMQNSINHIPTEDHHLNSVSIDSPQIILLKIEPNYRQNGQLFDQSNENFILQCSQNSETSRQESSRTRKGEEQTAENNNKVNYNQEQQIEEVELSPQSSLRKLYKIASSDSTGERRRFQSRERIIKSEMIENESKMYDSYEQEQQYEQYEEDSVNYAKYKQLRANTLYDLVTFPVLRSKMIKCVVRITNNRFFSRESIFDLYLYQEQRHLLRAKKKKLRTYFQVFGKEKNHVQQVAKIQSNFTRTQYKLVEFKKHTQFSQKCSVKTQKSFGTPFSSEIIKISRIQSQEEVEKKQDCYLAYQPNFLGFTQQKLVLIKAKKNLNKSQRFSDLKNCYQNCEQDRFLKFSTRLAQKGLDGKLILDFKQKNLQDSSKNMIIQDENGQAGLMFAKMKENLYILNVMHPFNLLEGFFLALCNLDRKLLNK